MTMPASQHAFRTPHLIAASCLAVLPTVAQAVETGSGALAALRAEASSYEHGEGVPKDPFRVPRCVAITTTIRLFL